MDLVVAKYEGGLVLNLFSSHGESPRLASDNSVKNLCAARKYLVRPLDIGRHRELPGNTDKRANQQRLTKMTTSHGQSSTAVPRKALFTCTLLLALVLTTMIVSGCGDSDGASNDDDDSGAKAHSKSVEAPATMCAKLGAASFKKCASGVLVSAHLSEIEQASLSNCDFEIASAKTSPRDVFEVARAAVRATCR